MAITLEQARAQLDAYLAAERATLLKQEYVIAGRRLTHADLAEIRAGVMQWRAIVGDLEGQAAAAAGTGHSRVRRIAPGW
jgi:hypothetical protein